MNVLARAGVVAALLAASAAAAAAQSASPSPSPTPLPEIGRVVTSDRHPEALSRTTRPTFVVDRTVLDDSGARSVADALAGVPGMNLFSYGAFGAQANYGIRGTTSSETLVLQDGVPIAAGSNGVVDLGSLSTIGVQRIEVVESGASTLYGSSATGGVINIITTAQVAKPSLRLATGSLGERDAAAQAAIGNFSVSFERRLATNVYDYPAFNYAGGNATPAGTRTGADAQQSALRLSYLAQIGGWTARLSAGDAGIDVGVPGGLDFATPGARQLTQRSDALLDLSHAFAGGTLDLTFAGVGQKLVYRDIVDLGGEDDTFDARTQASLRYVRGWTHADLVAGADFSRESAVLTFAPSTPPQPPIGAAAAQSALYAQLGYEPSSTTRVVAGLRGENDAPQGKILAPSLGARIDLGAARLTANAGTSFRVPTLIDLYYPGFSNPSLKPERLADYDATLAFPDAGGGIALGIFGRDGSNLIVLDPATFIPFNASRVSVNGLQLTAATRPFHHLRATTSLTDLYRALDTTTGMRLPYTPPITATLGFERPFDGGAVAFGAQVRVVGAVADVPNFGGGAPYADPYSAFTTADAYVRWRLAPSTILSVRARNLGNERYAPIFAYPAPGRTFEVELATR